MKEWLLDPYDREQSAAPYSLYRHLRDDEPLQHNEKRGFWALSRHADVLAAFLDPQTFSSAEGSFLDDDSGRVGHSLGSTDPPRHDRLRKLASAAFTPRRVAMLEPRIRKIARELLAPARDGVELDVPGSFATPLTSAVIAAILGVPEEDTACLQTWAQRSFRTGAGEAVDPEAQAEALQQLLGYLADAAALRRANPSGYDDLLGDLVQAEVDGDRLLEEEVKWLSQGIFVAGYETTANAIGNSMALLAQVPDERRTLRADPGLIADAFEEIVRWDSPAQGFKRTLTRPVELHGHSLPTGTTILLLPGAANRDERVFDEPDCFRAERRPRHHLAFGQGVHYCLGAPLARLENRIALEIILDWFPDWEIDWATAERSFTGRFMLRGYARLNALFERR